MNGVDHEYHVPGDTVLVCVALLIRAADGSNKNGFGNNTKKGVGEGLYGATC